MVVTNCHRQLGTCQKRWSQPLSEPRLCSSGGQYLSQKRRILGRQRQRGTLATEKAAKQQRNQRVHQGHDEEEENAENMEDFNLEQVLLEVVAQLAAGSLSK